VSVKDPVCGMPLDPERTRFKTEFLTSQYFFDSEYCMRSFIQGPKIAYFSMEIGIKSNIPTYNGGLGVLAGDVIRSSADLRIPLVAVTLISRKGYLRQKIMPDGRQVEFSDEWEGWLQEGRNTSKKRFHPRKVERRLCVQHSSRRMERTENIDEDYLKFMKCSQTKKGE
jgi:glucan phosphorylase